MEATDNDGGNNEEIEVRQSRSAPFRKYPLFPIEAETFPSVISLVVGHHEVNLTNQDLFTSFSQEKNHQTSTSSSSMIEENLFSGKHTMNFPDETQSDVKRKVILSYSPASYHGQSSSSGARSGVFKDSKPAKCSYRSTETQTTDLCNCRTPKKSSGTQFDIVPYKDTKTAKGLYKSIETQTVDLGDFEMPNRNYESKSSASEDSKHEDSSESAETRTSDCGTPKQISKSPSSISSKNNRPAECSCKIGIQTFDRCTSAHVLRFLHHHHGTSALICIYHGEPLPESRNANILFVKFYHNTGHGHAEDFLCNDLKNIVFETKKHREFLMEQKEKQSKLYVRIFLSNSPCNNCAGRLIEFRQNLLKDLGDVKPVLEIQVKSLYYVGVNKPGLLMLLKNAGCFLLRCLNWFDFYVALGCYAKCGLQNSDKIERTGVWDPATNTDIIKYLINVTVEWAVNLVEEKTSCTKSELNVLKLEALLTPRKAYYQPIFGPGVSILL